MKFPDIKSLEDLNPWAVEMAATTMALIRYYRLMAEFCTNHLEPALKQSTLEFPIRMETGHTFLTMKDGIEINGYLLIIHLEDTGEHFDYCFDMDKVDPRKYSNVRLLDPDVEPIDAQLQ
jgi:hypothetical protein